MSGEEDERMVFTTVRVFDIECAVKAINDLNALYAYDENGWQIGAPGDIQCAEFFSLYRIVILNTMRGVLVTQENNRLCASSVGKE